MLARRSVQQLLESSKSYLTITQLEGLVRRLKRNDRDAIEAEWELIMLAALASAGEVEHEPDLGGSARLDARFRSPALKFVADVTAVSDQQYDRENPVQQLEAALSRHAEELRKQGIEGGFDFDVRGIRGSVDRGTYKTKLVLPPVHQFKSIIFDGSFDKFLSAIREQPTRVHRHTVNKPKASITIDFKPGPDNLRTYSYLSYNLPHDSIHNVVYQALERKSDQIKRAGKRETGELAGVILCDGGCGMLRSTKGLHTRSLDEVINTFLSSSRTVDFVCLVEVRDSAAYGSTTKEFAVRTWSKRHSTAAGSLKIILDSAFRDLPSPIDNAINTLNHYTCAEGLPRLYGHYKRDSSMSDNTIEISLRAVMEYLAGRMNRREFEGIVHPDWLNHLKRRLERGEGIAEVSISCCPDQDDDGLVIRFAGPDPAIAPFQVPGKQSESGE